MDNQTPIEASDSAHYDPPGVNGEEHNAADVLDILRGESKLNPEPQDGAKPQTQAQPLTPSADGKPETKQNPPTPTDGQQQPAAAPLSPQPAAPDPLQSTLGQLNETLKSMSKPATQPGQQQEPAWQKTPEYQYNIPSEIMAGLTSEDPGVQTKALGAFATGMSRYVHQTVMGTVQQMLHQSFLPHIMNEVQGQMSTAEIYRDFYGSYADLNDPAIRPMIVAVAQEMAQKTPNFAYGPQFKQQLAQAVYQRLGRQVPGAQPTQTQQQAPAKPPQMLNGGARPMGGGGRRNELDDIADTILG